MSLHKKFAVTFLSVFLFAFLMPGEGPAALIWRKGEGWTWEHEGVATGTNPAEQFKIAQGLHARKQYRNAIDAYRRLVHHWPLSSSAQDARLGEAECLGAIGYHYKAFQQDQKLIKQN